MGPSANDFSNRRRPGRRGDGPGMGGPGRGPARGGPGGGQASGPRGGPGEGSWEGSRGRAGRGLNDPRRPSASSFRRPGSRPEGQGALDDRRWTRDRQERPSGEVWRRGEGGGGRQQTPPDDRPKWRVARRQEGPPARPFRPVRAVRGAGPSPDAELPRGDSHAEAAPSELIWGRHAALAALESERPIHRVWCTPEMRFRPTFLQLLREAKASGVLVEEVTWARLGQISGGAVHQGIVLQPAAADTLDLPSLIDGCRQLGESPLLVAVDGLTDPQNLGAILRSAEALGVHGMVLPQRRNAGLTGSVAKVAAGALEHLPVARVVNLNRSLETLKQEGYRVVGLDPQGTVSLQDADLEGPLVVITGSEGQGLSLLTRRSCDQLVRIPLRGATPSLNASVATALVLYEVARRGWMRGLQGTAKPPRLVRPHVPTEPLRSDGASLPTPASSAGKPAFKPVFKPEVTPDATPALTPDLPSSATPAEQSAGAWQASPPTSQPAAPPPPQPLADLAASAAVSGPVVVPPVSPAITPAVALAGAPAEGECDGAAGGVTAANDGDGLEARYARTDAPSAAETGPEPLAEPSSAVSPEASPEAAHTAPPEAPPQPSLEPSPLETPAEPSLEPLQEPVEWLGETPPLPTFPGDIHL